MVKGQDKGLGKTLAKGSCGSSSAPGCSPGCRAGHPPHGGQRKPGELADGFDAVAHQGAFQHRPDAGQGPYGLGVEDGQGLGGVVADPDGAELGGVGQQLGQHAGARSADRGEQAEVRGEPGPHQVGDPGRAAAEVLQRADHVEDGSAEGPARRA
ncbi:hypothetical protein P3T27_007686 [Kitasatospora sp. MAA19]|uniref:hypothetical protein n=1 Tax=Kitasatospora sp. MAA19 TaxID=3035090 RepID=UPI002473D256|nr:hypothetical protein [Kitasatospora sp. MAA19]MDH6710935.1 hypothetical protein [Kitasatospora sp. MAA19]